MKFRNLAAVLLLFPSVAGAAVDVMDPSAGDAAFPMVADGRAAPICIPTQAAEVVRIAARDLAADVERITGLRPEIRETLPERGPSIRVSLSLHAVDHWETFRLSATADTLTIQGSDKRGLAFGIYDLSRRIGVSPWHWWADVPVTKRSGIHLSTGTCPLEAPAVKYRGIFLNDEGWGLVPWAAKTFEPEAGNLGPKTYSRIFELMLRLRANTIWPAMHPGTTPFHQMPGNAKAADDYAIVLGSSHAEPMLRNNVGEWTQDKNLYNYATNRDGVLAYWEERVKQRTSGESLFTLGMRGIHDSAMVGFRHQHERIPALENIIAEQRGQLARHLGGDATRIAQIFCPYKEVLSDCNAGLKVPDDVTLVWPDDNFGYIRRFATVAERERSGGLGIYYHLSYLGHPLPWLWLDSLPPALTWSEMTRAYGQGARTVWIANVGDLKNTELSTEFFLNLAWHADRTGTDAPARFLRETAARDFGAKHAETIAGIWNRHQHLAFARKPEHLGWHLPKQAYQPTELTDREITDRLTAYAELVRDTDAVAARLPAGAGDAFYQLVAYPVTSAAAANHRYFLSERARRLRVRGDKPAAQAAFAEAMAAGQRVAGLTDRYNNDIAGGKWRGIVTVNGLSPRQWGSFQLPTVAPLESPDALVAVAGQERKRLADPEPAASALVTPADARPGDFVEHNGVVSIHAGNSGAKSDLPSGAGWRSIPGLGRSGSAVTVLPSTAVIDPASAPRLSYRFHVATGGKASALVSLLPTFPIIEGKGLRFALALDDGPSLPAAVTSGFEPKSDEWNERVLTNATGANIRFPEPLKAGWHTLHLVAVDAGVVVDKIVIDLGGLRPSYDGPPETRLSE